MGQTTSQIEAHIEGTRADLGSNLHELEQKVKSVTDWKQHFRSNPMTMVGVAFGGGVLLATMLGGTTSRRRSRDYSKSLPGSESRAEPSPSKEKALETLDHIKDALIGVAAARVKDFVGDIVPGFHDELRRGEEKAKSSANYPRP